jgi:hypothetical protein
VETEDFGVYVAGGNSWRQPGKKMFNSLKRFGPFRHYISGTGKNQEWEQAGSFSLTGSSSILFVLVESFSRSTSSTPASRPVGACRYARLIAIFFCGKTLPFLFSPRHPAFSAPSAVKVLV